ncbi:MAG: polysaccharide deacetylase family protein [bacterium]
MDIEEKNAKRDSRLRKVLNASVPLFTKGIIARSPVILTILSLLFMFYAVSFGRPEELPYGKFYAGGPRGKKQFALTYDDGPGPSTPALLKVLKDAGTAASFFMNGSSVRNFPKNVAETAAAGHLIGNHTDTHINWYKCEADDKAKLLEKEIMAAETEIAKATGVKTIFLRMPNGFVRDWVRGVAKKGGYILVNWTYGADWSALSKEDMLKGYLKNLRPGSILLLHDGGKKDRKTTIWLTGKILEEARKKGLSPVRIDTLLGIGGIPPE